LFAARRSRRRIASVGNASRRLPRTKSPVLWTRGFFAFGRGLLEEFLAEFFEHVPIKAKLRDKTVDWQFGIEVQQFKAKD